MSSHRVPDQLLSVSQFAAREGVTRARVLQLLSAGRIAGARRIGHHWVVPAAAALVRRAAGRPKGGGSTVAARGFLRRMARRYVWWLPPADALKRPHLVASQVMELGDYDDVVRMESVLGRDALAAALSRAEPGRFSAPSWTFWHYRLGLARSGRVPPLPKRVIR
ncbi:MAG: hypothetical protein HYV99_03765 [Betaproteobacteria bacterium]|nr:hypothetical protein [Betaproteobacteria bacterium]